MTPELHPALPFFAAAVLALVTRGWLRGAILLAAPVLGAIFLIGAGTDVFQQARIMDLILVPYRVDALSLIFGYAFLIGAFISILFSLKNQDTLEHVAAQVYVGSSLGVLFAGDLLSLFVCWEIMGLSSVFLIWASRTETSLQAGIRYLLFQVLSGVLLMAGALWYWNETGNMAFTRMELGSVGTWLMFLAFGLKAGFPLLHNWITDGYPNGTPTGSVFLCIFTTKAAVYTLARGFPGTELLIYIGATMTFFPIFYAVIENNLRRVLSYSIINQIGFMVAGVGIGTELALNGTAAHAFAHIIYKALLFMSIGAVLAQAGTVKASELGGLYRRMPYTATFCIVGAASISAFPLLSGFVSKAMVMSAMLKEGYLLPWLVLLFASAGVLEHAGIKIPYFGFFARHGSPAAREAPWNMLGAMGIAAVLCIGIGVRPDLLYGLLPYAMDYHPYDVAHVLTQLQLLLFATLAIVWLHRSGWYPAEVPSVNLDVEWTWRRVLPAASHRVVAILTTSRDAMVESVARIRSHGLYEAGRRHLQTALGRNWPTGSMVLWVGVFLAMMLIAGILSNLGG
jgi:multicomponent Na+:H+ antiporter subunit D